MRIHVPACRWRAALLGALPLTLFGWQAGASAQIYPHSPLDSQQRDQLYEDLRNDVAILDRQLGIYKRVVQLVSPSVVHIEASPLAQYRFRRDVEEAGSGVVVSLNDRFYILTNRHVIKHSDREHIRIELSDGRQLSPGRIWSDKDTDVAVMGVESEGLIPARIGNSGSAEIGEIVMAFGSPFNLRQSVTRGIISATGRSNLDLGDGEVAYQNFLQTDAAINPGNSGGPLVNLKGEVIGLNTAIASNSGGNEGIGFSIPIDIAARIMKQLVETGQVERGFLGVTLDGRFDARTARFVGLPRLMGARVKGVTADSPAAQGGLQVDDVILRFQETPIENDHHLISLVNLAEIGQEIKLVILREGQLVHREIRVGRHRDFADTISDEPATTR
jgi:serine protease Do